VFASLDDLEYQRQVRAWSRELELAGAAEADVLHLHHLTPINEAAARVAPEVPVVGQLHGTELLMLEQIAAGPPPQWPYADAWAERMRRWAQQCARLVVAPAGVPRALRLLEVPRERLVAVANGVDPDVFKPSQIDRAAFWRRILVEEPCGWLPGRPPGSAGYEPAPVTRLVEGTVLIYVGRFTAVKRVDRVIAAFAQAKRRLGPRAGLVLVGGHPGEWEGEHPAEVVDRIEAQDVFLAGWHPHESLPEFFAASDALVMASEREQFGQVLVEAMACGLPAVAPRSLGPATIIDDGETGWLVEPGDEDALSRALVEAVERPDERTRRGRAARDAVCERFTWSGVAATLAAVLDEVFAARREPPAAQVPD
jgi:glycosyltransferase involved in cell wall biosynthesis